jgi:hypothetical protein
MDYYGMIANIVFATWQLQHGIAVNVFMSYGRIGRAPSMTITKRGLRSTTLKK